jgi:hypothetical protein
MENGSGRSPGGHDIPIPVFASSLLLLSPSFSLVLIDLSVYLGGYFLSPLLLLLLLILLLILPMLLPRLISCLHRHSSSSEVSLVRDVLHISLFAAVLCTYYMCICMYVCIM